MVPLVQAAFARKINIVLDLESDLPSIEADKTQLEQVIMNLLINAAEAIGEHSGTVHVTTAGRRIAKGERTGFLSESEVSGDYIMLEVRDDGAGMDDQTLHRIFDPFFTTKFLGRGLGLSAVLGIMRGHKGAIRVASSPGQGTTFELLFPSSHAFAPARVEVAAPERKQEISPLGTALVVDDEPIVRNLFKSVLERSGFQAVVAEDGAQAIRIFAESPERFALILLDMVMPKMSGQDALPRLLEIRPDVPVIVTSGRVEEEVRRELQNFAIAGFIQKPCTVHAFIQKIRTFIGHGMMAAQP
jgi:CheY-like chemotaxis protein